MKNKHANCGSARALPSQGQDCCFVSRLVHAVMREFAREFGRDAADSRQSDCHPPRDTSTELVHAAQVARREVPARSPGNHRRVRPGSVRERVHQVLRTNGPLRRIEVVRQVAASLRLPADEQLEKRVEAILLDRADTHLRRVRRGVYEFSRNGEDAVRARVQA